VTRKVEEDTTVRDEIRRERIEAETDAGEAAEQPAGTPDQRRLLGRNRKTA
jgi:hypothetical protein